MVIYLIIPTYKIIEINYIKWYKVCIQNKNTINNICFILDIGTTSEFFKYSNSMFTFEQLNILIMTLSKFFK